MDLLLGLILLLIWLVILGIAVGLIIWVLRSFIPGTPEVVYKGIYVLGVLIALYVIILFLAGHLPMPRLR